MSGNTGSNNWILRGEKRPLRMDEDKGTEKGPEKDRNIIMQ